MLCSKKPPVTRKLSEDGPFELRFERNCDLTPCDFFAGKIEGAEGAGLLDAIRQCTRARMTHQPQLRGRYHVTKEASLHKKISKKKSTPCRMVQCMNACTG